MITFDVLLLSIVFLGFSGGIASELGNALGLDRFLSLGLFLWHTLFCLLFWHLSKTIVADANGYFDVALQGQFDWSPGSKFVESFTSLFAFYLEFDKLNCFFVFNLLGFIGLLLLAQVVTSFWLAGRGWRKYIPYLILLLPSLSFWSSAIGKDAPAFLAVCLASYSSLDVKRRKLLFALAILIMFAVRPHVAVFMLFAAGISFISAERIGYATRILLIIFVVATSVMTFSFVANYVGLDEDISIYGVSNYIETRQSYNMEGGGAVDVSLLPLPLKMLTYLFRPLFFDANSFFGVVASIENLFFLLIVLTIFLKGFMYLLCDNSFIVRYNMFFSGISLLVFSLVTSNSGIAVRQKTMILPSIIVLLSITVFQIHLKRQRLRHANSLQCFSGLSN